MDPELHQNYRLTRATAPSSIIVRLWWSLPIRNKTPILRRVVPCTADRRRPNAPCRWLTCPSYRRIQRRWANDTGNKHWHKWEDPASSDWKQPFDPPLSKKELVLEQSLDGYCLTVPFYVGQQNTAFFIDGQEFYSKGQNSTKAVQIVVQQHFVHTFYTLHITPDSQTSWIETYIWDTETRILLATHKKRCICDCRAMYELRQQQKLIQT